jgi:hypothetical protein
MFKNYEIENLQKIIEDIENELKDTYQEHFQLEEILSVVQKAFEESETFDEIVNYIISNLEIDDDQVEIDYIIETIEKNLKD